MNTGKDIRVAIGLSFISALTLFGGYQYQERLHNGGAVIGTAVPIGTGTFRFHHPLAGSGSMTSHYDRGLLTLNGELQATKTGRPAVFAFQATFTEEGAHQNAALSWRSRTAEISASSSGYNPLTVRIQGRVRGRNLDEVFEVPGPLQTATTEGRLQLAFPYKGLFRSGFLSYVEKICEQSFSSLTLPCEQDRCFQMEGLQASLKGVSPHTRLREYDRS